ncbi:MAG: nuclear transport factor 2 family protein [Algoriphagus sp.]|nr:nuclear transport factor 2 family protein [Algoriphagus sp.]
MKYSLILIFAFSTLFSCSSRDEAKKKENLALVKKYLEAVETNNPAMMDSVLAEEYKGFGPSVSDSTNKRDAIDNWKYNAENLYESIKYTRFQNIAVTIGEGEEAEAGDWVSSWALVTIKYKDERGPVNAWVNVAYKIKDGKIIHSRTFYNEADVLRQLGYEFLPPIQ